MSGWLSILLGGVGLVGFYLALGWLMRRQKALYGGIAEKWFTELRGRGWRVTPGETPQEFTIEHVLHGVPVIYVQKYVSTGPGDDEKWTLQAHASATIGAPIGDLSVQPEGLLERVGKMLGGQDITLGDSKFDPIFRITCTDPEIARRILTQSARQAMLDAREKLNGAIYLRDSKLTWRGASASPNLNIEQIADLLAITATRLGH